MSGVESTPCCCKENRPCCISITYEVSECLCLEKDPECPNSRPCPEPPPLPTVQTRRVECTGSDAECQQRALELCSTFPNVISCSGTYYSNLTCAEIADAECDPIPFKICKTYTCGWCEPIVTGCYVDYGTDPCPPPPTCTPDPCCDVEPPSLCCCRAGDGTRTVVPCPDPVPANCVQIQDPADCENCGEYYTPLPCSSVCCCTEPNCVVLWDLTPQPANHCASGAIAGPGSCVRDNNNCNGDILTLNYCCCSCYACEYCSSDVAELDACLVAMNQAGFNCLCPVAVTGLCGPNCSSPNPLLGSSENAAYTPVKSLESGVVLGPDKKPSINNLFLLGYGTFNL